MPNSVAFYCWVVVIHLFACSFVAAQERDDGLKRARELRRQGDYEAALKEAERVAASQATPEAFFALGQIRFVAASREEDPEKTQQGYEAALESFTRAKGVDPSRLAYWRGACMEMLKHDEEEVIETLASAADRYVDAYLRMARVCLAMKDWDRARRFATSVIEHSEAPAEDEAIIWRAESDEARKRLLSWIRQEAFFYRACALYKQEMPGWGLKDCEKAVALDPAYMPAHLQWGRVLCRKGDHFDAKDKYAHVIKSAKSETLRENAKKLLRECEGGHARELPDYIISTSTRTPRLRSRAPASVTVIPREQFRGLGVRYLTDALRIVPGIEVVRTSSTESGVSARGFNDDPSASSGILGLLDGRPVYNEFFGSVVWESLPVTTACIDRVEVVRGPGSFVHGPNAMHGLVHVTTPSPLDYSRNEVAVYGSAGSYHSTVDTLTYVRREATSGFKARLAWDDIDDFSPGGDNARDKGMLELRYETLLGRRKDKDWRLDLISGICRHKTNVLIPTFAGAAAATLAGESLEPYATARCELGDLKIVGSWTRLDSRVEPDQVYVPFDVTTDTADLDGQYSQELGKWHTLTAGMGYRLAAFETQDRDIAGGRHRTGLGWGFLQDEYEFIEKRFWLTGGIRYDHHSVSGGHVSPRLAAVFKVDPDAEQYLRASAGYGYRNPSLRELWFDMPIDLGGLTATVKGNEDLKAEQMRSFELGYAGRWGEPKTHTRAEAVAYYNRINREVDFLPSSFAPLELMPFNVGKEDAWGIELEVEHALTGGILAFANYAYGIRQNRETRRRNPLAPRHKANAGVRALVHDFTLTLWWTYFDETEGYDPAGIGMLGNRLDAYNLLNFRLEWNFLKRHADCTAFLQAFNMLDQDHREHPEGDSYGLILMGGLELKW